MFFFWIFFFQGFVISDYEGIDRITSPPHANYSYSIEQSINAGLDMVSSFVYCLLSLHVRDSNF